MEIYILGTGKMSNALLRGFYGECEKITIIGRDKQKLKKIKDKFVDLDIIVLDKPLTIKNKNIILCVNTNALVDVSKKILYEQNAIISILAMVGIKDIKKNIKSKCYVKALMNTAAAYKKTTTVMCGDNSFKRDALEMFNLIGKSFWIDNEYHVDIASSIVGCAPAFLSLVAQSISDGGVLSGLPRSYANKLTAELFYSTACLLEHKHPSAIKEEIMTPGGMTAKGVAKLEEKGVRDAFIQAINTIYSS